jgi:ABC-type glycerol-3-phosphate transport system substrate-binding protein
MKMTRIVFAMAVAAMLMLAVSGTSQAAPIAPLSGAVTADQSNVTPVYWYHHRWYHHRWYRHHRRCWRGYYGRVHCRWW